MSEIPDLSATALSASIHRREVSCTEVLDAFLHQIDRLNPRVNAIVAMADHDALHALAGERDAQLARGEVVSKMWEYIKKNNLQNPANKREIIADAKLKPVFSGLDKVTMFEMNKHLAKHLK